LANLVLGFFTLVELVFVGAGAVIAYMMARLATRPPLGWDLLTVSFALAFVRELVFLYVYLFAPTADPWTSVGQVITLPIVVFILIGVYSLYTDFKRHLARSQSEILAPQGQQQQ
jgi:hypothetical protein